MSHSLGESRQARHGRTARLFPFRADMLRGRARKIYGAGPLV